MIEIAQNTKLLVIGDSHARFWNGQDDCNGDDLIEGIQTLKINGALAWSLARLGSTSRGRETTFETLANARRNGFQGTVMLSFGEIDIRNHILKHAIDIGLARAVFNVAERYIGFISEVAREWPNVVIWGPMVSRADDMYFHPKTPTYGTQSERNFATILFIKALQHLLDGKSIPVLTLHSLLLLEDGTTKTDLLYDGAHLSQTMMPIALFELRKATGLTFNAVRNVLMLTDNLLTEFSSIHTMTYAGCEWLAIEFRQSLFLSHICLKESVRELRLATGVQIEHFDLALAHADVHHDIASEKHVAVNRFTRCLWLSVPGRALSIEDLSLFVRTTDLASGSRGRGCTLASLLNLTEVVISDTFFTAMPAGPTDTSGR